MRAGDDRGAGDGLYPHGARQGRAAAGRHPRHALRNALIPYLTVGPSRIVAFVGGLDAKRLDLSPGLSLSVHGADGRALTAECDHVACVEKRGHRICHIAESKLDTQVITALQRIYARQHYDGGWNWWDGEKSDPQTSVYVVAMGSHSKPGKSGYTISESVLAKGIGFLRTNVPELRRNDAVWQYNRTAFMLIRTGARR